MLKTTLIGFKCVELQRNLATEYVNFEETQVSRIFYIMNLEGQNDDNVWFARVIVRVVVPAGVWFVKM